MAEKIIDPFINIMDIPLVATDLSGLSTGVASQNLFGVLNVAGGSNVKIDGLNGRITMTRQSDGMTGLVIGNV